MTDDINFVQKARREKLEALVAMGITPFAYGYERTHHAVEAVASLGAGVAEGAPSEKFHPFYTHHLCRVQMQFMEL